MSLRYLYRIDRTADCLITDLRAIILFGRRRGAYEWSIFLDQIPADVISTSSDDSGSSNDEADNAAPAPTVRRRNARVATTADARLLLNLAKLRTLFAEDATAGPVAVAALERMLDGVSLPADLHVRRWTGQPTGRLGRLILSRAEVNGNFYLAGLLLWYAVRNQADDFADWFFITALIAAGVIRQALMVHRFWRRWRKTSYLVTRTRLEVTRDEPGGLRTDSEFLENLTPPAQLGPKAPLRLAFVRNPEQRTVELVGLADPEQVRRLILTAQLAARISPADGRVPVETPTPTPAPTPTPIP